jgi:low affinity Fe/Cu permease
MAPDLCLSGTQAAPRALPGMSLANVKGWLTDIGVATSRPAAFGVFALYAVAWVTLGNGLEWHSLATLATWGMTLVIQRAEHRDTQAVHAKLDELLKANGRPGLMKVDDEDAEEVETRREEIRRRG